MTDQIGTGRLGTGQVGTGQVGTGRVVLVPGVPALLPEYAGLTDPVADLRRACLAAVRWLCEPGHPVSVAADPQGRRVATHLVQVAGGRLDPAGTGPSRALLAVGNGSARRSAAAPGGLDGRAPAYDAGLGAALRGPDVPALAALDLGRGAELLASLDGIAQLPRHLTPGHVATVDYDNDPFGVQYWVVRWACES